MHCSSIVVLTGSNFSFTINGQDCGCNVPQLHLWFLFLAQVEKKMPRRMLLQSAMCAQLKSLSRSLVVAIEVSFKTPLTFPS